MLEPDPGTVENGCTGAPVPGTVVTANEALRPVLSVTVIAFGSFKQLFGAAAAVTPTVNMPFAPRTMGGFAETIALDDGDTTME